MIIIIWNPTLDTHMADFSNWRSQFVSQTLLLSHTRGTFLKSLILFIPHSVILIRGEFTSKRDRTRRGTFSLTKFVKIVSRFQGCVASRFNGSLLKK